MPSGAPLQESCGETFSPTQFGLGIGALGAFMLATFFGIMVPSLNVADVSVKGAAAA